ncbi:hypothetical protein PPTG_13879 [Phytophthora nicotianae INRA-310]|uniref:Chitin-binding type-1 domain-containing protein n=1 Tax=Phytophthora nicotianae (strain INRA-310) TaxID=761204 RepID=W2Q1A8_PHYN3|nr:hypothetical protein PPTG_13879 [Phytophthora nicotianae INRA-310]ETN06075.1 hypothetical protein PPTG_13879 [Phytophthora nicotianae INRA-310]
MKTLLLLLLACTLTPSAVFGHGYIVNPEMTWVVNPFYDKNAPAAFYDASSTFGQNPLDIYPNLRHIVAQDTPYTNIPLIAANANKNCGMTSTTGPTRTISGYLKFDVDPSALHEGPCEVWVDDVRTMVARSCKTTYTGRPWNIPVDMTKCTGSTCVVQFIWIGTHNPTYEVFKNCFPVASGTTTSQAPSTQAPTTQAPATQAPTTSPTSCTNVAQNGGTCGASNGNKYCPGTQCCSQYGYCGVGTAWCSSNPNSIYNGNGKCSGGGTVACSPVAPYGGSCGASNGGVYCPGSQCCSQYGYCGVGSPWCDNNPNSIYNGGNCA